MAADARGTAEATGLDPRKAILIRLVVPPLMLSFVVGVLWLHDQKGWSGLTHALLVAFALFGGYELATLLRQRASRIRPWPIAFLCGALSAVAWLAPDDPGLRMALRCGLVVLALVWILLRHLPDLAGETLEAIGSSFLVVGFVGLCFSSLGELALGPDGARRLLLVVVVAKASDMGGWLVGRPFGRHKILPTVSPGKSWEGLLGGVAASAALAAWLPGLMALSPEATWPVIGLLGFGTLLAIVSLLAGFFWSACKRRVGSKHGADLIPEIGGVLDLIDSLLLAGPTAIVVLLLAGA